MGWEAQRGRQLRNLASASPLGSWCLCCHCCLTLNKKKRVLEKNQCNRGHEVGFAMHLMGLKELSSVTAALLSLSSPCRMVKREPGSGMAVEGASDPRTPGPPNSVNICHQMTYVPL